MAKTGRHKWTFTRRLRRHAFGWRGSRTAGQRIKEAVSEIRAVARKDPMTGAEGAVLFLEKISPAIEQVDSSSGALGTAVNNAIIALVPIIAKAPAGDKCRRKWLDRLWKAIAEDDIPYIELLPEYWGELCGSTELASWWADELISLVRQNWSGKGGNTGGYFDGIPACFSALFAAGRYEEIMELLGLAPHKFWSDRQWGMKALAAMGKKAEALRYAEESRGLNEPDEVISAACEEILLSSGLRDEAYDRYAIEANQKTTYLATFRAIAKKYPHKEPGDILRDLVASSPGSEGKWFAAAKSAGLFQEAIALAAKSPCDPRTLTRAARDMKEKEPYFAVEAGIAALYWLLAGYGYEIQGVDVMNACRYTMEAAAHGGCLPEVRERILKMISQGNTADGLVSRIIRHELDGSARNAVF